MNIKKIFAEVTGGSIQGYENEHGVRIFKGIPYAAPPVGEFRFCPPQPVIPWEGVKDCTEYGPISMQREAGGWGGIPQPIRDMLYNHPIFGPIAREREQEGMGGISPWTEEFIDIGRSYKNGTMSEDCLNLNVWTCEKEGKRLPVLVYIHGGGNNSGSGACEIYDGQALARQGIVVVTLNYRLGALGFLAFKDKEGEEIKGNYALLDQIAALQWVQNNIQCFGGDPNRVTIAGQSAGSGNCQSLLISPMAAGLFHQVICMSANMYSANPMPTLTLQETQRQAAEKLGDVTVKELRAMPVDEFLEFTDGKHLQRACIDGEVQVQQIWEAYANGNYNCCNMMFGTVTEDCMLFPALKLLPGESPMLPVVEVTPENYMKKIELSMGDDTDTCLQLYPVDMNEENVVGSLKKIMLDGMIYGYYHAMQKKIEGDPVHMNYIYNFSHAVPDTPQRMAVNGAFHSGDLGYWFNNFTNTYKRPWSEEDYQLGALMSGYLVNFVANGNPNGKDCNGRELPVWISVNESTEFSYMKLDTNAGNTKIQKEKAKFWANRR